MEYIRSYQAAVTSEDSHDILRSVNPRLGQKVGEVKKNSDEKGSDNLFRLGRGKEIYILATVKDN